MKYLSLLICVFISIQLSAQNAVENYFSNHLENDKSTVVQVSGKMFQYAAAVVPEEMESDEELPVKDAKEFLNNITSFTLVKVEALADRNAEYRRGLRLLGDEYEELVRVRDNDNRFSLLINETNDVVHEIVALVTTDTEFVAASLTGEMRLDQIQDILSNVESEDMQSMIKRADVNVEDLKVFPNPSKVNTSVMVELPQKMIGGTMVLYDLSGNVVKTNTVDESKIEIDTQGLTPGQYVVDINKNGVTLKKKFIVVD